MSAARSALFARLVPCLAAALAALVSTAAPASAQQTVNFTLGGFVPRGYDARVHDDVLVATHFDGAPVSREHGGPARVIIPKLYAWKGAKFVKGIHFLPGDRPGFWEVRGYSNTADPWKEERYS